jgi:hypothetical protein
MKSLYSLIVLSVLICSCQNEIKSSRHNEPKERVDKVHTTETVKKENDSIGILSNEAKEFLLNPINISEYKKLKGGSNSGSAKNYDFHYKPEFKGFYLRFFVFPNFGENGPELITYRRGKEIGDYIDEDEILIQFFSNRKDEDLKELNLVGVSQKNVIEKLGNPTFKKNGILVYYYDNRILIHTIKWYRWAYLKRPINSYEDIPKELLSER